MPARKLAAASRSTSDLYLGRDNLIQLGEALLEPAIMGLVIWGLSIAYEGEIAPSYFILSVLVFALLFPGKPRMQATLWQSNIDILLSCFTIQLIIVFLGYATDSL